MSKSIYKKKDSSFIQNHHYVYQITELSTNRKYIGVRSSSIFPKDDLGKNYFSSSTDKKFIKDQKENRSNYKYEVLSEYSSREEAMNEEIRLHKLYDVSRSKEYINVCNSTSSGFCLYGKVVVKNKNGDIFIVEDDDPRYLSGEIEHHTKGGDSKHSVR